MKRDGIRVVFESRCSPLGLTTNNILMKRIDAAESSTHGRNCRAGLNDGIRVEIQKLWNTEFK